MGRQIFSESLELFKFEATGNDFVVMSSDSPLADSYWARQLCDRRRGIGADGVLVVDFSSPTTPRMIIYNADGSRPEMCGNGVRCVASYLEHVKDYVLPVTILTDAGPRQVSKGFKEKSCSHYSVWMGAPEISEQVALTYRNKELLLHKVSMGNPHAVLFDPECFNDQDLWALGAMLNNSHSEFPDGVNLEVVSLREGELVGEGVYDEMYEKEPLSCRVYERGVGETQACGTGACAVAVAAMAEGIVPGPRVQVQLPGGLLDIEWVGRGSEEEFVLMTGESCCVGKIQLSNQWLDQRRRS